MWQVTAFIPHLWQAPSRGSSPDTARGSAGPGAAIVYVPPPLLFAKCASWATSAADTRWLAVQADYSACEAAGEQRLLLGGEGGMGAILWMVPVGREEDVSLVRWVTVLVTMGGTLVCLYETLRVEPSGGGTEGQEVGGSGGLGKGGNAGDPEMVRRTSGPQRMTGDEGNANSGGGDMDVGETESGSNREGSRREAGGVVRRGRGKSPGD